MISKLKEDERDGFINSAIRSTFFSSNISDILKSNYFSSNSIWMSASLNLVRNSIALRAFKLFTGLPSFGQGQVYNRRSSAVWILLRSTTRWGLSHPLTIAVFWRCSPLPVARSRHPDWFHSRRVAVCHCERDNYDSLTNSFLWCGNHVRIRVGNDCASRRFVRA